MSSKRIAELKGKRHDNVIRDINNMISKLERDFSN
ncbi:Rha family transcriptional regulator [Emticicia sp. 21SJ11W-3]